MKNIGIWMDKRQALILDTTKAENGFLTLMSEIDDFHVQGGSGTKFKGGPQDVVHDSKYLAHENQQFKTYFKKITEHIKDAEQLALFGPAEAVKKFRKELSEQYKMLSSKVVTLQTADSMTENQTKALILDFFKSYH